MVSNAQVQRKTLEDENYPVWKVDDLGKPLGRSITNASTEKTIFSGLKHPLVPTLSKILLTRLPTLPSTPVATICSAWRRQQLLFRGLISYLKTEILLSLCLGRAGGFCARALWSSSLLHSCIPGPHCAGRICQALFL